MEILLQDLLPGQEYNIQLRAKNKNGVSQWSRAYSFTTSSDVTAPNPATGLTWNVSGTSFVGAWTAPTLDSDGGDLKDFRDFKVTLTADATDVIFYVTEPRFDLSLSRNITAWGSPKPSVSIKVEVRDNVGNLSSAVTASATNSIPSDITGFDSTSALGGINLTWDSVTDDDFKQYEIYVGGSSGFTPGPSNLKVVTTSNSVFYATDILTLQYFKIRAVDAFNQGSANYALESQLAYPLDGVPDSVAPSQPSAPTISTGTLVAQVSHDMTKQAGGNLESDVDYLEIHASATTGFTPSSSTLRGTIDSAGQGIAVSAAFFFPTTDSMTNLYWKVIAVDRSKNKSSASNQATGLPNLIENANILNATITDAKIQNLSAAKLVAGTAIVNDLFIESNLTVSATGSIESDNFVTTVSGWKISADGSVEFNDGLFRGDLNLSTIYRTKQFSMQMGNMDSYFVWEGGDTIDGQEPTMLFQGWSFKPDGVGSFDPIRELQSVIRLTPFGELQIMFDPSHSSAILSIDGNNVRDAAGVVMDRYYGWVDKRMGMGKENDISFSSNPEGRDPYGNTYYFDEQAVTNSTNAMGADHEVNSRVQAYSEADGSISKYLPNSRVRIASETSGTLTSKNIIQDGMDLFDNAGGTAYYGTNTTRNRININAMLTNITFSAVYDKLRTGIELTLTSAGSGNHSIAFTTGSTTYPITVAAGDEYYMTFYGYRPGALSLDYRFFMKTNTGVTVYGPTTSFNTGLTNTQLTQNSNYNITMGDLLVVPSGATSAHFGIEFIGTVASNQNIRISGIQVIKTFAQVSGVRQLQSNYNQEYFSAVGDSYTSSGQAEIILTSDANTAGYRGFANPKPYLHSQIEFDVSGNDFTSGSLGFESTNIKILPTGLRIGTYGEPQLPHGEYRTLSTISSLPAFTSQKLLFNTNRTLDTYDGLTMSSFWNDMGIAMDNTPGYTTFVPQRAGLFLIHFSASYSPSVGSGTEILFADLCKDSNNAIIESGHFDQNSGRDSVTFVTALSVNEKVYIQLTHNGATKTVNGAASFVQLL